jgi:hypothetical protein
MCRKDNFEFQIQKNNQKPSSMPLFGSVIHFLCSSENKLAVTKVKMEYSHGKEKIYKRGPGEYAGLSRAD